MKLKGKEGRSRKSQKAMFFTLLSSYKMYVFSFVITVSSLHVLLAFFGWVIMELCLKKPQNTRIQQMVFTQPVKLVVVGEEGQRRLEIPVCVENVREFHIPSKRLKSQY